MEEQILVSDSGTPEAHHKAEVIAAVCAELTRGRLMEAIAIVKEKYPFEPLKNVGRRYSKIQMLQIFYRDGFIDRYSGLRLVLPGVLRILSVRMPEAFPYHKNSKTDECHFAFWELLPTIDHILPVSRNGTNDESNLVTTSMLKNGAKANFTMEELGWKLLPKGDIHAWDGQMSWFLSEVKRDPELLNLPYINEWKMAVDSMQRSAGKFDPAFGF